MLIHIIPPISNTIALQNQIEETRVVFKVEFIRPS